MKAIIFNDSIIGPKTFFAMLSASLSAVMENVLYGEIFCIGTQNDTHIKIDHLVLNGLEIEPYYEALIEEVIIEELNDLKKEKVVLPVQVYTDDKFNDGLDFDQFLDRSDILFVISYAEKTCEFDTKKEPFKTLFSGEKFLGNCIKFKIPLNLEVL